MAKSMLLTDSRELVDRIIKLECLTDNLSISDLFLSMGL